MLDEILAEIRNYFVVKVHSGDFEVIGGKLSPLDFLQNGQYFFNSSLCGTVFLFFVVV